MDHETPTSAMAELAPKGHRPTCRLRIAAERRVSRPQIETRGAGGDGGGERLWLRPAERRASAGGTDENANADSDGKHEERALLRLTGELRDRSAANPAAHIGEARGAIEGRALPAAETPAYVAEDRQERFGDVTSGRGRSVRTAASGLLAELAQLLLDAAQVMGDCGNGRVEVPGSMLKHLLLFQSP